MQDNETKKSQINRNKIRNITMCAMFVAIMAILSQISIPLPNLVPITLQTFAAALCGYFLGLKKGMITITVYILVGAVGVPVFSSFKGGFGVLFGYTGGFIWGFLFLVMACATFNKKKIGIPLGIIGVLLCHLCGVLQYYNVSENTFFQSFLSVSLPYLLKDFISVVIAYFFAKRLNKIKK